MLLKNRDPLNMKETVRFPKSLAEYYLMHELFEIGFYDKLSNTFPGYFFPLTAHTWHIPQILSLAPAMLTTFPNLPFSQGIIFCAIAWTLDKNI